MRFVTRETAKRQKIEVAGTEKKTEWVIVMESYDADLIKEDLNDNVEFVVSACNLNVAETTLFQVLAAYYSLQQAHQATRKMKLRHVTENRADDQEEDSSSLLDAVELLKKEVSIHMGGVIMLSRFRRTGIKIK